MTAQATPSKTLETPAHPLLSDWAINRKLEKLEEDYRCDQEKKPRAKRLRQYAEDIEEVYQAEIESGRVADSPDLWAGVYSQKVLVSVSPKIVSLLWNLGHRIWLTGGGAPGEQAAFEEAQRDLSRLRVELTAKLDNAKQAKEAEKAQPTLQTAVDAQNGDGSRQSSAVREDGTPKAGPIAANVRRQGTNPTFEEFAGGLFTEQLEKSDAHRVGADGILSIADKLDASVFIPPLKYLERRDRKTIASYNQKVGSKALTTWHKLASNRKHQHAMRRRLAHASEKVRKYSSAPLPATTF